MDYLFLHTGIVPQDTVIPLPPVDSARILTSKPAIEASDSQVSGFNQVLYSSIDTPSIGKRQAPFIGQPALQEIIPTEGTIHNPYRLYFNSSENFLENNALVFLRANQDQAFKQKTSFQSSASIPSGTSFLPSFRERFQPAGNWVFLVILFVVLIFIWIKVFYNKYFSFIANSLVSYQLSAKLFHERNFLLRRVSFILNIIYHIVLSLFLFEFFSNRDLYPLQLKSYNLFLFFLNVLILFTLGRSLLLGLFNLIFKTSAVVSEYVHNNFLVNKSLGIVLFPLAIAIRYAPDQLTEVLLVAGAAMIGAGLLFKLVRGFQIIIRRDVLFSYLILYLCTLEILPLFIGYKVFISLL